MRNGRTEGALLGPLHIDMDPLVIARGLGELVDLLLGDGHPFGRGHILTDTSGQLGQVCKCFHRLDFIHLRAFRLSVT